MCFLDQKTKRKLGEVQRGTVLTVPYTNDRMLKRKRKRSAIMDS